MASVYVVKVLCIFLVLSRFILGFAFVVLSDAIAICGAVPLVLFSAAVPLVLFSAFVHSYSSSGKFACA